MPPLCFYYIREKTSRNWARHVYNQPLYAESTGGKTMCFKCCSQILTRNTSQCLTLHIFCTTSGGSYSENDPSTVRAYPGPPKAFLLPGLPTHLHLMHTGYGAMRPVLSSHSPLSSLPHKSNSHQVKTYTKKYTYRMAMEINTILSLSRNLNTLENNLKRS